MSRHHTLFFKDNSDEEKVANIIVSFSQLDEALALWLTNHFLKLNDTDKNEKDRDDFEKLILEKLSFEQKSSVVNKLLDDRHKVRGFKSKLGKVGKIRNRIAHDTGLLGIPTNINGAYEDFNILMAELESFMDLVYYEYNSDMTYAYTQQHEK